MMKTVKDVIMIYDYFKNISKKYVWNDMSLNKL